MGLSDLLARLSIQADTPDTPCNPVEVSAKPAWIGACTLDTPDTPQIIKAGDVAAEAIADMAGNPLSSFQAEIAVDRNSSILPTVADTDDRRTCQQCLNLRRRICSIAKPERGAMVVANMGYRPQPDSLHRCAGYLPNATDNDQRLGGERWPGLTDTKGTK
ncbi:MAG: hypothetical protein PHV02_10495 [Rhodocyclaceae bacterium]|nr:hypothetical protein [Rhodocyclaceae bacterium]